MGLFKGEAKGEEKERREGDSRENGGERGSGRKRRVAGDQNVLVHFEGDTAPQGQEYREVASNEFDG